RSNSEDKVPVLLVIFNRPDTTLKVMEAIRKYQPKMLYVASDGARAEKHGEKEIVQNTRDLVLQNVDWPCEVKTVFREENIGCGYGVSSAITWFLEHEEMGIILEDDCQASLLLRRFTEKVQGRGTNKGSRW
ncbi:nucleotide-diphospho-sugar transferase, partial [bacterium]|nr:nucleotide-diphospho-sugar transferase [bacterium]